LRLFSLRKLLLWKDAIPTQKIPDIVLPFGAME